MRRRLLATVVLGTLAVTGWATPAGAQAIGVAASNFRTTLRSLEPSVPGVELSVIEVGNRLQLVNRSDTEMVVLGYDGEPYLRVGPAGVFENRRSPAAYLNRDRQATVPVPDTADPQAEPDWHRVSSGRVARWYDHRVHWMGAIDPPTVRQEPRERHVVIPDWTVELRHGDRPVTATGELVWEPGPDWLPWLLVAAVPLGAMTLLWGAALWSGSTSWWPRPLAAVVVLLLVVSVSSAVARTGDLADAPLLVASWAGGVFAVGLLVRRRRAGLLAAAVAAAGVGLFGAVPALSDLSRSQLPSALPAPLARMSVALTLGLALTVLVAAVAARSRATSISAPRIY